MGQSLNNIKRRINTVNSTRKITSAMKLVANVKSRRFMRELKNHEDFVKETKTILNDALFSLNDDELTTINPLLTQYSNAKKRLVIIVTSSLGLCGGYNNEVYKYYSDFYKDGDEVITVGEKGFIEYSKKKNLQIYTEFTNVLDKVEISELKGLIDFIDSKYLTGEYRSVEVIYHRYINSLISKVESIQILPLIFKEEKKVEISPVFLPDINTVINTLIPQYINVTIYEKFVSSLVSEYSARRNAMDNADKNAKDLVEKLRLEYNKERQSSITQEITEVVSGSLNK